MGQCDICVATKMYFSALFIRNAGFWRIHAVLVWHKWTLATFLGILKTNAGFCQEEMEGRLSMRILGACVFKKAKPPWDPVFSWAASKTVYIFPFLLRMMVQITSAWIISHGLDCFGRSLDGWNHPILTWIMVQLTHIFDMCWNHCFPRRSIKYSQSPRKTYQTQYIPTLVVLYLVILGYTWLIFLLFLGNCHLGLWRRLLQWNLLSARWSDTSDKVLSSKFTGAQTGTLGDETCGADPWCILYYLLLFLLGIPVRLIQWHICTYIMYNKDTIVQIMQIMTQVWLGLGFHFDFRFVCQNHVTITHYIFGSDGCVCFYRDFLFVGQLFWFCKIPKRDIRPKKTSRRKWVPEIQRIQRDSKMFWETLNLFPPDPSWLWWVDARDAHELFVATRQ